MSRLSFHCRHRYASGFELDVSFETDQRATSLFGSSGSGKTSVLMLIAGLFRPDFGRIELGGRVLFDSATRRSLPANERRVGVVFQDHMLFPHLSVEGNLQYGRRRGNRCRRAIDYDRVIEVLELGDLLQRYPRQLSGGQRQRVALGRSLLAGPELLLLDEPLAALDEPLKQRVLDYLERVLEEWQIPILYVSHGAAEVRRLAQHVIVLDSGRVSAQGSPERVLEGESRQ